MAWPKPTHLGPFCGAKYLRFWRESEVLRLIFRLPCVCVENFGVIFDYFAFASISPSYGILLVSARFGLFVEILIFK